MKATLRASDRPFDANSVVYRKAGEKGHLEPVRLSCAFRRVGHKEVLGLVPKSSIGTSADGTEVLNHQGMKVGILRKFSSKFKGEDADSVDALFYVAEFEATNKKSPKEVLYAAAFTCNFYNNIYNGGMVKAQKIPRPRELLGPEGRSNSWKELTNGFVTGDIVGPEILSADGQVEFSRLGVVRGRHHREFAKKGEGGTPVVSRSRALMGFIVAKQQNDAFVLPAEQLARSFDLEFLVPPTSNVRAAPAREENQLIPTELPLEPQVGLPLNPRFNTLEG